MLLVLVLIGLNMRPLLTSIGPLLPQLRAASGMNFTMASLLTALPMVAMGGLALAGGWITRHIRERDSVAVGLLMIIIGALMREVAPHSVVLLSSALLGGIGIGVIQVVMPTVIKRQFQRRMPQVMGLWSAALMGGGGLGAALTPWIADRSEIWNSSLAWWAVPAIIALIGWWPQSRHSAETGPRNAQNTIRIIRNPRAWTLGIYFGVINGGYGSLIAWLPPYYMQLGNSAQFSGTLLALMTVGQTAGALLLPMLARHQDRRRLLLASLALQMIGFLGFILWPAHLSVFWAFACGVGLGGAFPLCLVLALDHAGHPVISGKLVAFMQGIGFIIAGLSPYLSGVLRSLSGDFVVDWVFHACSIVGLMLLTLRFVPSRYPQEWVATEQG
ncbi:Cyanate permease [Pseudocitrobacter vendiensis]|uniref:Cyanate permease n=2 Tax=Pseudocitrobacter vendiensis TaxID=2488306 RepID=A0ABM9FEM8_9ENTR|nr:Cyanate permease [Pseudocitrobacter vendiensis]